MPSMVLVTDCAQDRWRDFVKRDTSRALQTVEQVQKQLAKVEDSLRENQPNAETSTAKLSRYRKQLDRAPEISEQIVGLKQLMESSFSSVQSSMAAIREQIGKMEHEMEHEKHANGAMPPERASPVMNNRGLLPPTPPMLPSPVHELNVHHYEHARNAARVGRGGSMSMNPFRN